MSNPRPRPRPLPIPPSQISRNHGSGSSCDSSEASGKQTNVNSGEYSRTGSPFTPPQTMLTSPNQPGILVQSPMSGEQPGSPRPPWWKLSPRFEELQLPNEEKSQFIRSTPPKRPRPLPIPGASSSDTRPPPVKEAPPPDPSSSTLPLNIYPKHLKMLVDFQVSTGQESFSSDTNWRTFAPNHVAQNLNAAESKRQDLIFELIKSEKQYLYHLEAINDLYVQPLQSSSLTVVHPDRRRPFTQDISYRIDEIRALHQKLLTTLYEVQRREFPLIQGIAAPMFDTFILDFREIYLSYIVHIPVALAVAEDELENNILFNDFHESIVTRPATRGLDLKMLINAPYKRLSKYGELVTAIIEANTRDGSVSPTGDSSSRELESELLREFAASVRDVVRLGTFQGSMNTPTPAQPVNWRSLVGREAPSPGDIEEKRQSAMLELITGEMLYIKDLESIETVFIQPLKAGSTPIIPASNLNTFIHAVFHNVQEILTLHKQMLRKLFKIQRDEFPVLKSITAPVYDTALNWVDPYIEYFAQYPMAVLAIDQELAQNPRFKTFYENTHYKRQDLKSLIYRPVDRLAKISFPLVEIQRRSPPTNKDGLETIPQILDIIGYLRRATNVVVDDGTMKAKLWGYKQSLVYPFAGEIETCLDLDLCLGLNDPLRTMVHSGKLLRESETAGEWSEVFVLLLDNYLIVTAPKEKEGVTKYYIEKRIALELLTLGSFTNAPVPRFQPTSRGNMNIFGRGRSIDHKDYLYPLHLVAYASITGRPTASCLNLILYADGEESRTKWRTELEGAIGLRKHVQEAKMAFHLTALSDLETFRIAPPLALGPAGSNGWISGRVHCSATLTIFNEQGGRLQLIAAGCDEGIGMALQGDMTTWRRLMPLKGVTQCATLDDFGIFLVLAEGDLYAYPIENLVPAARNFIMASGGARPRTFQRMNTKSDVHHFTIGTYQGRTLVAYVMKHGTDSIVCVQEPVVGKISDSSRNNSWWSSARATGQGKYWFRDYIQPFKVASTAFDCTFFKGKIVIPFNKGFHVLNLSNLDLSVVLPRRDESRFGSILARRCEASRPLGIFPASGSDLLACYEDFGFWIDRKGDISRRNSNGVPYIIEWECKARKVAYHEPYLLIFTPRFIEVRNAHTGQLCQFIQGDGLKSTCNGTTTLNGLTTDDGSIREDQIQIVMDVPPQNEYVIVGNQSTQRLWQLVPTVPLSFDGPPS